MAGSVNVVREDGGAVERWRSNLVEEEDGQQLVIDVVVDELVDEVLVENVM